MKTLARFAILGALCAGASTMLAQSLSYEVYKTKVEPIFYKKREGHARCVVCHSESNNAFKLQAWNSDSTSFTEEQSQANFKMISRLVVAGKPELSVLLLHPLSKDAGGHEFHSGGRQFASKDDPDWKTIEAWVKGSN